MIIWFRNWDYISHFLLAASLCMHMPFGSLDTSLLTYIIYSRLKVNTDNSKVMVVKRRKKATAQDPTFLFDWKPLKIIVKEYKYLDLI